MQTVLVDVDATIERLAAKSFKTDPMVDARFSRVTSIVSSAYKRHGAILERALSVALEQVPHLEVWAESNFKVPDAADRLAGDDATALGNALRYSGLGERTLQIDLLVFDRNTGRLGSYECKRGFGYHDSGKKRSMLRDLRCLQMLLSSYGRERGLPINESEARMIFYFGQCSIGKPWSLTREELDVHFGVPITERVEAVNAYFAEKLNELLADAAQD
jgi:hypothetical protein